jgi:cell pole-organizing protein PopZ
MAKAPGQNATVEEILASIRQAISDDDAKRTVERPRAMVSERRPTASVSDVFADAGAGEPPEAVSSSEAEEEAAPTEPHPDQDVIEQAIEQALDGVRAEIEQGRTILSRTRSRPAEKIIAPRTLPRPIRQPLARREPPALTRRALLSPRTDARVSASFDDLARAMVDGNPHQLDAVVEELLRPMLKDWLEDNLPQMVERLVREEIERVSRGRR